MKIIREKLGRRELEQMTERFENMVKAVVDVQNEIIAVDAELHADLEALLQEQGSKQAHLWGINFYPQLQGEEFVEFDSMINVRPSQANRSRNVDNPETRKKILEIVEKRIER